MSVITYFNGPFLLILFCLPIHRLGLLIINSPFVFPLLLSMVFIFDITGLFLGVEL